MPQQIVRGAAGQRRLAGGIDRREDHAGHAVKRRGEIRSQGQRARVAVRLEHGPDAPGAGLPGRVDQRPDLRGMMCVVGNHPDAARFRHRFEAAPGKREARQRPAGGLQADAAAFRGRDGRQGVQDVVATRQGQAQRGRPPARGPHPAARAGRTRFEVCRAVSGLRIQAVGNAPGGGPHPRGFGIVGAIDHHPGLLRESAETVHQGFRRGEMLHVVEFDVVDDGDLRNIVRQRAVAFVGFDHQPVRGAHPRRGAVRRQFAADAPRGVHAATAQDVRRHRRGRGLAMRAGDGDGPPQLRQHGQHPAAAIERDSLLLRRRAFRMPRLQRGAEDRPVRVLQMRRIVAGCCGNAAGPQPGQRARRAAVAAGDVQAFGCQQPGQAGHADAAHAHQVDARPRRPDPAPEVLAPAAIPGVHGVRALASTRSAKAAVPFFTPSRSAASRRRASRSGCRIVCAR